MMAKIKVHILNFYWIASHLEILLENSSVEPHTFYLLDRFSTPKDQWSCATASGKFGADLRQSFMNEASSTYSFDINADPNKITEAWKKYWYETEEKANLLGNNCAVAVQWFLTEFAGIPKPNISNISLNHLAFGIIWPSFIPCITLPGRVMSNAKFHIEAKNNPEIAAQYTRLFLYTSMALAAMTFASSIFSLIVAATILTEGIPTLAITATVGLASAYGFFKGYNILSAKNIANDLKKTDECVINSLEWNTI